MRIGKKFGFSSPEKESDLNISRKPLVGINILPKPLKKRKKRKCFKGFNQGKWTDEEHTEFLKAFRIYGNDWKNIERKIKCRSSVQIRSHSQKRLMKLMEKYKINERNINHSVKNIIEDEDKPYFEAFRIFSFKKIFLITKVLKEHSIKLPTINLCQVRRDSFGLYSQKKEKTNYSNKNGLFMKKSEYLRNINQLIIKELSNIRVSFNEIMQNISCIEFTFLGELNSLYFARQLIGISKNCGHMLVPNNSLSSEFMYIVNICSEIYSLLKFNEKSIKEFYNV